MNPREKPINFSLRLVLFWNAAAAAAPEGRALKYETMIDSSRRRRG